MDISIFGLGYVGSVMAACLANKKFKVIGVDVQQEKIDTINNGNALIVEPEIQELTAQAVAKGYLSATHNVENAIHTTEVSFICVGTPSLNNNKIDLRYIETVCQEIGKALKTKNKFHIIAIRSTLVPGTLKNTIIPILEKHSEKKNGKHFSICINPEFLQEGNAVYDFYHPSQSIIGATDEISFQTISKITRSYTQTESICLPIEITEIIKYVYNTWHALKVCFANEIGNICRKLDIDSHKVMEVFCDDKKLNISPHYLKPGFAFGGSCLPKDVRALMYESRQLNLELPILNSILNSNKLQIEAAINMIMPYQNRRIGILGLSFKSNTDDLRESPMVEVVERLLGKGYKLKIYDKNVFEAKRKGVNLEYLNKHLPHIMPFLTNDISDVLNQSDVIVIGNKNKEFENIINKIKIDKLLIDLVRVNTNTKHLPHYQGICW